MLKGNATNTPSGIIPARFLTAWSKFYRFIVIYGNLQNLNTKLSLIVKVPILYMIYQRKKRSEISLKTYIHSKQLSVYGLLLIYTFFFYEIDFKQNDFLTDPFRK